MAEQFHQPTTVEETCELLVEKADHRIIAGGQSLLPLLRATRYEPEGFIDITRVDEIRSVRVEDDTIRIGAGVTWADLEADPVVNERLPTVASLSGDIGDVQVRNRGTIGGSLSHADPAADMGALLLCHDCEIVGRSVDGRRTIPIEEFFEGLFESALAEDELLTEVRVRDPGPRSGGAYEKFEIRHGGFSTVGVGATVHLSPDGEAFESARVGLAACGPAPIAVESVADIASGESVSDPEVLESVGDAVYETADPEGDSYGSETYKKQVAANLAIEALDRATDRARKEVQTD